ncbi:unnamed protein product [Rangifer tarandus platyrhynchus]|uniref:Uncharacterized protein n=1 Tax=Rangifer tarandus platyrhynchus TaxID=3082113 RepID=A0ABN8Y313_RANTA|nr:unnamed protein product [Rangifer tarandus platyrhynchus]
MKQEEEAERERSRLPRLRLGQEKRWETRSAPRPLPAPPGRPLSICRRALRASSLRGDWRGWGAGSPGSGRGSRGSVGEGLLSGRVGRRQAGPAGRVCLPGAGGSGDALRRGWADAPAPGREERPGEARRGSHSFYTPSWKQSRVV